MAKAKLKTTKTEVGAGKFLESIKDDQQRRDSKVIADLMKKATGAEPKMWGPSIIGFGDVKLKYESGRELDWFRLGFSPRKQALTLYILDGSADQQAMLGKLGKYKTGKGCLYIAKLDQVDMAVLEKLIHHAARNKKGGN